jgi:hypothetical protein
MYKEIKNVFFERLGNMIFIHESGGVGVVWNGVFQTYVMVFR